MIGHNDIAIDTQPLINNAEVKALNNDFNWFRMNKYWQPVCDGEGDKVDKYPIYKFVSIHDAIILQKLRHYFI